MKNRIIKYSVIISLLALIPNLVSAETSNDVISGIKTQINTRLKLAAHGPPQFVMSGIINCTKDKKCNINGVRFGLTPNTIIIGELTNGVQAQAKGTMKNGKPNFATRIVVK